VPFSTGGAFTVTKVVHVEDPPGPVTVAVYVVLVVGKVRDVSFIENAPPNGAMVIAVATPLVDHLRVVALPAIIVDGLAEMLQVGAAGGGGRGGAFTVTVV
jgi:hypothetical protein